MNICQNGGQCVFISDGKVACVCPSSFVGQYCELPVYIQCNGQPNCLCHRDYVIKIWKFKFLINLLIFFIFEGYMPTRWFMQMLPRLFWTKVYNLKKKLFILLMIFKFFTKIKKMRSTSTRSSNYNTITIPPTTTNTISPTTTTTTW
jgi:hypothetical protein